MFEVISGLWCGERSVGAGADLGSEMQEFGSWMSGLCLGGGFGISRRRGRRALVLVALYSRSGKVEGKVWKKKVKLLVFI